MRSIYVNGEWVPENNATVSVFDRGFLFGDAIYEVAAVIDGKIIDFNGHVARLKRSLGALGISMPESEEKLLALFKEIVRRNEISEGLVYLQVTRGTQDRDFLYPDTLKPTIVMFTQRKSVLSNPKWETGISVKTAPDGRWVNRQIKTVQLLYSSLMKTEAVKEGFDDVLFVEDEKITEASSANFHIVTKDGRLLTRELSNALLHGITRASVLDLARGSNLLVEERAFSVEEAKEAAEAFITSATSFVTPVVSIDGTAVGTGKVGPVSKELLKIYIVESVGQGIPV